MRDIDMMWIVNLTHIFRFNVWGKSCKPILTEFPLFDGILFLQTCKLLMTIHYEGDTELTGR